MTDKEALLLAAKARGIAVERVHGPEEYTLFGPWLVGVLNGAAHSIWRPYHSGEDAFQLAVWLDLCVGSRKCWRPWTDNTLIWVGPEVLQDGLAATQRAIVHCAANIGASLL